MEYVYVLMADGDGTLRSQDEPFGVAVTTEEEAKKFVERGKVGYSQSYWKLRIFEDSEEAVKWAFSDENDSC